MRKALLPMLASLALCGAATTAMVMSSARAQPAPHTPIMVAAATAPGLQLAANDASPPRGLRQSSPQDVAARIKQMCTDGYARQSAGLAYLEASLELTATQQSSFQHWKDIKLGIARRHADACAQRPLRRMAQHRTGAQGANTWPSPADRMARQEEHLKQRLADLQSERPALDAFYTALSPQQKTVLQRAAMRQAMTDHRSRDGQDGGMMRRHRFAEAMGPHRPMDGNPMDRSPGGPDGPPPER